MKMCVEDKISIFQGGKIFMMSGVKSFQMVKIFRGSNMELFTIVRRTKKILVKQSLQNFHNFHGSKLSCEQQLLGSKFTNF